MSSEKPSDCVDERELENVELHRAESMSQSTSDSAVDSIQTRPPADNKNSSVIDYVGSRAKSVFDKWPPMAAELVMFLYMFSYVMRSVSSTSMILDKVCLVHLGYSEDVCDRLKDYPSVKQEVTRMGNNYGLGHTMVQMLPSSVMALFVGSWSDKYGRKFPLILALCGIIVDGVGSSLCAYFLHSRVEYYLLPAVFTGCSGGFIGVLTVLYSYASDTSTAENRTMKYALMQLAFGMAMPLGSLVGGWVFKFYGYIPVFASSACGHVLGLFCVVFCLRETRGLDAADDFWTKFRSFWSLEGVKSSLRTTTQRRPNKGRAQILVLILAMSVIVFSYASQSSIGYLYAHYQFDWDNTMYSTISSVYMVIGFTLMMIIVPLSRKANVADPALGILGALSLMLKNVGIGLANATWIYHLAMVLGLFVSLAMLAARSRVSKVVPKNDLGKVFAFVSTAESLLPIAATAAITQSFNATLAFFPGLTFVIMGTLALIPVGVFIWVFRLPATNNEGTDEGTHKRDPEAKDQQAPEKPPSTTKRGPTDV